MGDDMIVQEKQGATLLNRIDVEKIDSFDDFRRVSDHIKWIDSELKAGRFLKTRGREVLVSVPNSTSFNIISIPRKEEYIDYIKSWVNVYNKSLDYLEGSLNAACLENKFIKRDNSGWTIPIQVNGTFQRQVIKWPTFNPESAEYAKELQRILNTYNNLKTIFLESIKSRKIGVSVKKSSVMLNPANQVSLPKENPKSLKTSMVKQVASYAKRNINPEIEEAIQAEMESKTAGDDERLVIQKVSDGAILDSSDIGALKKQNTDIVVLTCQDSSKSKEEDIFVSNAARCQAESFNTGAFIYGKATDDHMGAIELKRILKMLDNFDNKFSGLVIYSIDNEYAQKNRNSDLKLLDFINVYNAIARAINQAGYIVMLSMDLKSAEIIDDINRRYNMQSEYEVIFMAVVRDIDSVSKNASVIVVDPGNDYDIVKISNREIINRLNAEIKGESLARVA